MTLTNHNPDLGDADIVAMVAAEYGEVYSIHTPPDNPARRHVEFCDVRQAQAAKQALEGIAAKIPTISEVRAPPFECSALSVPSCSAWPRHGLFI